MMVFGWRGGVRLDKLRPRGGVRRREEVGTCTGVDGAALEVDVDMAATVNLQKLRVSGMRLAWGGGLLWRVLLSLPFAPSQRILRYKSNCSRDSRRAEDPAAPTAHDGVSAAPDDLSLPDSRHEHESAQELTNLL